MIKYLQRRATSHLKPYNFIERLDLKRAGEKNLPSRERRVLMIALPKLYLHSCNHTAFLKWFLLIKQYLQGSNAGTSWQKRQGGDSSKIPLILPFPSAVS